MTAPVFVAPLPAEPAGELLLEGPEGRHAARVRRVEPGERVDLVDGRGTRARCRVTVVDGDRVRCAVEEVEREPAPAPRVVVVQALPKGERAELAVEVLSEVGVDVVVPWQAERSVVQWRGERGAKALEKWRATAREAGKQARRARFAEVAEAATTREVADLLRGAALPLVLGEEAAEPLAGVEVPATGDVVLVVGPEGGVSGAELAAFAAAGARAVRLGPSVLRTSTAGAVAAGVVLARTTRWS
ncbi:16S rRNA (uracil1498-N3)-methyltransferase [Motilibacter rhizosphaerae]|uniref:Ribosomal RNA small subunit methyltransferase E n=1 Tax=Motilibacter rhizosphaerae TaxID=598652 RepID=A0A4Q7NRW5_9ACTN|nr:16S rRNA (uracil(1498)-N(3))-methyltransferase [Motilibacter rhizosphaerae]RZS89735.1 16S rRNA (uracil1498-N3)-methyltransferase [Motilibacter rhizosphaerae]